MLSGEFHIQKSLMGYSPWGCKESDMTEQFSLLLRTTESPKERKVIRIEVKKKKITPELKMEAD